MVQYALLNVKLGAKMHY